jgi:hypothetical protein
MASNGRLPAPTQGRDAQRAFKFFFGGLRKIEQCVGLRHRQPFRTFGNFDDFVACPHLTLFDHAKVKPRPMMRNQQRGHRRLIHSYADAVAGHTRLGDFEQRAADPVTITDQYLAVRQAFHGEVFAELTEGKILAFELVLPVAVRIHLIDKDSAMLSAVSGQITLGVTVDVEPAHETPPLHRLLPHGGVNSLTTPRDLAGMTYVDRQ